MDLVLSNIPVRINMHLGVNGLLIQVNRVLRPICHDGITLEHANDICQLLTSRYELFATVR